MELAHGGIPLELLAKLAVGLIDIYWLRARIFVSGLNHSKAIVNYNPIMAKYQPYFLPRWLFLVLNIYMIVVLALSGLTDWLPMKHWAVTLGYLFMVLTTTDMFLVAREREKRQSAKTKEYPEGCYGDF